MDDEEQLSRIRELRRKKILKAETDLAFAEFRDLQHTLLSSKWRDLVFQLLSSHMHIGPRQTLGMAKLP